MVAGADNYRPFAAGSFNIFCPDQRGGPFYLYAVLKLAKNKLIIG